MAHFKRSIDSLHNVIPSKKQYLEVINYLVNEFYPKYKVSKNNYRLIRYYFDDNKPLVK